MRNYLQVALAAALLFLLISSAGTVAQEGQIPYSQLYGIPQGNLTLRDAPASSFFFLKGDAIGVVPEFLPLEIEDRKEIRTLFGNQEWLKVRPAGEPNQESGFSGWVYNGTTLGADGLYSPYIDLVPELPTEENQGGN